MPTELTFDQAFPSKWLKAADLDPDTSTVLTIKDIASEPIGQDREMALVVYFKELPNKGLILNKTNAMTLASLYGRDPNAAIGKKIGLFVTEVTFSGRLVDAVRISSKVPQARAPKTVAEPEEPPDWEEAL